MKKLLLILCLGFIICACSQKESKPSVELESDNSSPTGMLANMAKSIEDATNAAANTGEAKPYYFSEELKNAVSNCTPYSEDIYEKNPEMRKAASAMMSMFSDKLDASDFKFIFDVKGKQGDKCQVFLTYDFGFNKTELNCEFSAETQAKLVAAMNDKSTETTTKKIDAGIMSVTTTGREYDFVVSEIMNRDCKPLEQQPPSQEKIKEMQHKMLAFSDRFKTSLKTCTPDTEVFKVMGMEMNKVKIKGKEKGKCHVVLQGFHILLNDNELSLSGFDELGELVADETRATYSPSYKYQGTLFALSRCEQANKNNSANQDFGSGKEEVSITDNVSVFRGVNSSYKDGACKLAITLVMKRNGKEEDHSLSCDIKQPQLSQYLAPYSKLLEQHGPKVTFDEGFFANSFGEQTEEVSKGDQELFLKLYKEGICKKVN